MAKKPIVLQSGEDAFSFPSVGEAKARLKQVLRSKQSGERFDPASEESKLIAALLNRHRDAKAILEKPIAHFEIVVPEWRGSQQCFAIRYEDGELRPFSYLDCITPFSPMSDLTAALRDEIQVQVWDVNRKDGEVVHHDEKQFNQIRDEWLKAEQLSAGEIEIESGQGKRYSLKDRALAERWRAFHKEHAKLVAVPTDQHRQIHYGTSGEEEQ